jgi:ubiquinone/menaquinone biosynthesis C-methylase UbiE
MKKESATLNYYDGIAKGYSNLYHEEQIKKISLIKKYFPTKGLILDLGSGDGVLNQFLDKEIKLISLDLSFELLKLNKNKNKIQASILNLPFKNNSFEFISSFTVFQDMPNLKKAITETKRVLKKEGVFILSFLHMAKDVTILLEEIKNNFEIIEKFKEEKDYIFVLKN